MSKVVLWIFFIMVMIAITKVCTLQNHTVRQSSLNEANNILSLLDTICFIIWLSAPRFLRTFGQPIGKYILIHIHRQRRMRLCKHVSKYYLTWKSKQNIISNEKYNKIKDKIHETLVNSDYFWHLLSKRFRNEHRKLLNDMKKKQKMFRKKETFVNILRTPTKA